MPSPCETPAEATPPPPAAGAHPDAMAKLAGRFAVQGLRHDAASATLWCALCSRQTQTHRETQTNAQTHTQIETHTQTNALTQTQTQTETETHRETETQTHAPSPPFPVCVTGEEGREEGVRRVGVVPTQAGVLSHCAGRTHLLRYEAEVLAGARARWFPVDLHGRPALLDRDALHPAHVFGPGRMLLDETLAGGALLGVDVCGAVRLRPGHKYTVIEMLAPAAGSLTREIDIGHAPGSSSAPRPRARLFYEPETPSTTQVKQKIRRGRRAREGSSGRNDTDGSAWATMQDIIRCGVGALPGFYDEGRRFSSKKARTSNLKELLDGVNASIIGEAKLRERRKKNFIKFNT